MLFIIAGFLGGGIALLRGGRLNNLARLSIRWSGLPLLAVGLQIYVLYGPGKTESRPFSFPALLILASYGLLLITIVVNRRLPGLAWLGLGAALNLLVIAVNGGWMPVTADLLVQAGLLDTASALVPGQRVWASKDVVTVSQEIHLRWLSDRLVIPKAGVFSAVFSVGDVLMMFGLFRLIQAGAMRRITHHRETAAQNSRRDTQH